MLSLIIDLSLFTCGDQQISVAVDIDIFMKTLQKPLVSVIVYLKILVKLYWYGIYVRDLHTCCLMPESHIAKVLLLVKI